MDRTPTKTFICGCGHSGSTLLATMFAAHPDVYVPLRETGIFLPSWTDETYTDLLKESNGQHLVEKTPKHVRHIDAIRKEVPDAKFVFTVRNGFDSIYSFMQRGYEPEKAAARWINDNLKVKKELNSPDVTYVPLEHLLIRPIVVLQRLCEFIGIQYSEQMIRYHEFNIEWDLGTGKHEQRRMKQMNQPLTLGSTGKGDGLPNDIKKLLKRNGIADDLMSLFQYS